MNKASSSVQRADTLARDLAGRDIDPNAVAQTFTYLRVLLHRAGDNTRAQQQAFTTWWTWLETVSGRGADAVVRSNKTVRYFQTTRSVCQAHLSRLEPAIALTTLAWAIRLMRFYASDPHAPQWFGDTPPPVSIAADTGGPTRPRREEPPPPPPPPAAPTLPQVGEQFTGKILEDDGANVAIEVPHFTHKQALARIDQAVRGTRSYREGNAARVEVVQSRTLKSGLTLLEVKPVQAEGQQPKKKKKKGK
jgi:hypothetical protein